MRSLKFLIIIAFIANLSTLILYKNVVNNHEGGSSSIMFLFGWMPLLWGITMISVSVLAIVNRRILFQKSLLKWTSLTLLFATPLPIITIYNLSKPGAKVIQTSSGENQIDGKLFYHEYWEFASSHKEYVYKYYVADTLTIAKYGKNIALKKDSIWVYYDEKGDTLRLEYYKNDSLLSLKEYKSQ